MEHKELSVGDILRRTAFPFLLFSTVLAALLILSWLLLVPRVRTTEIGGTVRNIAELQEYKNALEEEIDTLESRRMAFLLPVHNDLYTSIQTMKRKRDRFEDVRRALSRVRRDLLPDNPDSIHIAAISYNADTRIAQVRGEVSQVGPRSMTVLARFIEKIENIPFVIEVRSSRFERNQDSDGNFYSPFVLHIQLNNVSSTRP